MSFAEIKKAINSDLSVPLNEYLSRTDNFKLMPIVSAEYKLSRAVENETIIEINSENGGYFYGGYFGSISVSAYKESDFWYNLKIWVDNELFYATHDYIFKTWSTDRSSKGSHVFTIAPYKAIRSGDNWSRDIMNGLQTSHTRIQNLQFVGNQTSNQAPNEIIGIYERVPFNKTIKVTYSCGGNLFINSSSFVSVAYSLND